MAGCIGGGKKDANRILGFEVTSEKDDWFFTFYYIYNKWIKLSFKYIIKIDLVLSDRFKN